jgi:hypothetical protein
MKDGTSKHEPSAGTIVPYLNLTTRALQAVAWNPHRARGCRAAGLLLGRRLWCGAVGDRFNRVDVRACGRWQLATATAARHSALTTRFPGLIGRPLVGSPLLVRGATTLAGDLTLLLG